jgi:hypothetical protein
MKEKHENLFSTNWSSYETPINIQFSWPFVPILLTTSGDMEQREQRNQGPMLWSNFGKNYQRFELRTPVVSAKIFKNNKLGPSNSSVAKSANEGMINLLWCSRGWVRCCTHGYFLKFLWLRYIDTLAEKVPAGQCL